MNPFATECLALAAAALETDVETLAPLLSTPPDLSKGDYALPCFPLAKVRRMAPQKIAAEAAAAITPTGRVARVEAAGPYLNFFIDRDLERREVIGAIRADRTGYGHSNAGGGRHVVIDFSSPNIAKPMHVGHMRSTNIGHALCRLHRAAGYEIVGINHLGDWGTQFGLLLEAYTRWGDEAALEADAIGHLLALYVRFNAEAKTDESMHAAGRERFRQLEAGDASMRALWERFRVLSLKRFERVYELLGVTFERVAGEAEYAPVLDETIAWVEGQDATEMSDGALVVRLADEESLPPAMLRKSDGATTYLTRDLAALKDRITRYDPVKLLYVVGAPQRDHFRQLFGLADRLGLDWGARCAHVGFGQITIGDDKLSTREGRVVHLEDVLQTAIDRVRQLIEEKNPELEGLDDVARQVGVAAIVFADLKTARVKDVKFSWDDVTAFEGDTGPYCCYTHARSCSILRKHGAELPTDADLGRLDTPEDLAVVRTLARFGSVVLRAAEELEPSLLARYLLDLCALWNGHIHTHHVLQDEDPPLRDARLTLVDAVRQVLHNGLQLLGIQAPEAM